MNRREFIKMTVQTAIALSPLIQYGCEVALGEKEEKSNLYKNELEEILSKVNIPENSKFITINGAEQKLYLLKYINQDQANLIKEYLISTGKNGFGNIAGTGRTPTGLHIILGKSGEGEKIGTVFYGGKPSNIITRIHKDNVDRGTDHVTTRVIFIDGIEPNNRNTASRRIYIHGTNEEGLIGKPASKGCIRMNNKDIIELYNLVEIGIYVNIKP